MSGIAGIIRFDGAPVEAEQIKTMTAAMAYRGPDGINHWVRGSVALGQCMLRTTPESLEETQPLANDDESLVLVMDGRVDNWEELRRELLSRGAKLRTRSDAELVLRAYEVWGRDCLQHIDGDFAFVIWDVRRQEVFAARDRMGNKPFNYHWDGKTFVFASELHAILPLPWVPEELNEDTLAEFLATEWYSKEETFWQGVFRLIAAHKMVVDTRGPSSEQYWEPDLWATFSYGKDQDYIEHYRELFTDVVQRMSRSYRPLACKVSGGLDSSAIFAVAEKLRRQKRLPAPGLDGYTLAFHEDPDANDLPYARALGKFLGIGIHEIPPSDMPLSWYEERAQAYRNFPQFPSGANSDELNRRASLHSRVVLSGVGGDEWWQGSRDYYAEEIAQWRLDRLYVCLKSDAADFGVGQAVSWLMRRGLFQLLPAGLQAGLRGLIRGSSSSSTRDTFWLSTRLRERLEERRAQFNQQEPKRVRCAGQRELLQQLSDPYRQIAGEITESYVAGFGMENRLPFHDPSLVQFAFSTPARLRLRGNRTKYILVHALKDQMPRLIRERTNKAAFTFLYRRYIDKLREAPTGTNGEEFAAWLVPEGVDRLIRICRETPGLGWPEWTLWSICGCRGIVRKVSGATGSNETNTNDVTGKEDVQ
jgi:asparagine synthase (glutamine-hydrolysing)